MQDEIFETSDRETRLDVFLADCTAYSRSRIQNLIRAGAAKVNGKIAKANTLLRIGDAVHLHVSVPEETAVIAEDIPLAVVYEDADLIVVDKPQGMVVHPAPGHASGTLVNALLFHVKDLSGVGGEKRPGIVHRIDRMTSGLIVAAKNDFTHLALSEQFSTHAAGRSYLALVDGNLKEDSGTVEAPIGRHKTDRKRMAATAGGRRAVTHWQVLMRFMTHTLIRATLETGRTHQIRVHMAYLQHPVTGDAVYGAKKPQLGLIGQALHGYRLQLTHPRTGEMLSFYSDLPEYFLCALKKLGYTGDGTEWTGEEKG